MVEHIINPDYEQGKWWKLPEGYTDLGWQRDYDNCEELRHCTLLGHKPMEYQTIKRSMYRYSNTETVYMCDCCKIAWHIDSTD